MDAKWKRLALFVWFALPLSGQTTSGVMSPVLTRAYDNSRTGSNPHETVLTQTTRRPAWNQAPLQPERWMATRAVWKPSR